MKSMKVSNNARFFLLTLICCTLLFFTGCQSAQNTLVQKDSQSGQTNLAAGHTDQEADSQALKVYFFDVGQGDSILIQSNDHAMLIDAGTNENGPVVVNYLNQLGVTKLDYVIGTHPHEDHIGGLDDVITSFDVKSVILPEKEHTTKTFEDVLDAVIEKNLTITPASAGDSYTLGDAAFTILGPLKAYDELNNWSVCLKLTYKETSFMFTGDAEAEAEKDMIAHGTDLSADVLKVGHHGSDTSSCSEFLEAVNPASGVISVGADNSYGHPCAQTLEKLTQRGVAVYRTDVLGTVTALSDGHTITFDQTPLTFASAPSESVQVYVTQTGKKYHCSHCPYLKDSHIAIDLDEAKKQGYTPCGKCNPPA